MSEYVLASVVTEEDWQRYHEIRRRELFEDKDRDFYDENHPDERKVGNTPLLFKFQGKGVATARFDLYADNQAVIRLIAVDSSLQGQGIGRLLAERLIQFGHTKKVRKILVNAAPTAIGFYGKIGFKVDSWDPSELVGISEDSTQMSLHL